MKRFFYLLLVVIFTISMAFLGISCKAAEEPAAEEPAAEEEAAEEPVAEEPAGVTLTVLNWGNPDEEKIYNEAIARFIEKHPNVKVDHSLTPVESWTTYIDKWVTLIASGTAPDVINIAIEGVHLAVEKGLLLSLDDYLEKDPEVAKLKDEIPQSILNGLSVNNNLYLMPNGSQTMAVYYNTRLFEEKGIQIPENWTWDDFLKIAQEMTYGEGEDKIYGFGQAWGFFQLSPWWTTNDAYPVTDDYSAPNLTDPKFIESISFVNDLINKYKVSPNPIGIDVYSQFSGGKLAMVGAGRWPLNAWREVGFEEFDLVPFPKNRSNSTVFGCAGWGIGSESANQELAWELIKEFESEQTLKETCALGQQIPVIESLVASDAFLVDIPKNVELLWEVMKDAKPVAAPPYFRDLEATFMRYLEMVIAGELTPEEAMEQANKEIEDVIKR